VLFLVLVWILLFAVSLALLELLLTTFLGSREVQSVISLDWAGYTVMSDAANPQPEVIGVNASWTVPRVGASSSDSFSAAWIGIGGQLDKTLIQTGTEHDFVNGQEAYSVWYELLPNNSITITTMNIYPGDVISASISLQSSFTNEWIIQIYDKTNGQGFSQNFVYNSSQLSAEWILERPTVNNQLTTLADFGSVTFTEAYATINGNAGTIGSFPYSYVAMNNRQNVQLTSVSSLSMNGSSFTVTYQTS
jgi:hypothetical protein